MFTFRSLAFLGTVAFVIVVGLLASLLARGYRLDPTRGGIKPTGILVVTSSPDGAQILINGILESATNATISLPPNLYDVEIKKEGYLSWKKRLEIKKEEVTKIDTFLFPAAPSLSPVTFAGAVKPVLSIDGGKIVFGIPAIDKSEPEKSGIWVLDLASLPIGFSGDPRRITNINPQGASWFWSPDGREILIFTPNGAFLTTTTQYTPDTSLINVTGARLEKVLEGWQKEQIKKREAILSYLTDSVKDILTRKTERLSISADQKRILYLASSDAVIPSSTSSLAGSSTQKQEREIKKGQIYVYDIKEDRNFLISETPAAIQGANPLYGLETLDPKVKNASLQLNLSSFPLLTSTLYWFPSSLNLVLAEHDRITIMDYDGTNRQVVYSGPYEAPFAFPSPNGNRLLLLTHFGAGENNLTNLYSLGLK